MSRAQRSSGKWNAASASAISPVVADADEPSPPPMPSLARAASTSLPASLARTSTVSSVVRGEHPAPRVGEGQRALVELRQQPDRVHLERRRVDDPLEAVRRDVVATRGCRASGRGCAAASRRIVPTTWRNIGPRSEPGSLGSWTFAPRRAWQTAKPPVSADVVIQMSIPNLLMSSVQSSSSR